MTPSPIQILHIPLHRDLVAALEAEMQDEMSKAPNPVTIEAYTAAALTNFVYNKQVQRELEAQQRRINEEVRTKIITWTNATLQHLKLKP